MSAMMKRLRNNREDGNTMVWVVVLLMVMLGVFGLASDLALATYTRITLQGAADSAAVAGANQTYTYNGGLYVDNRAPDRKADTAAKKAYNLQRSTLGNLSTPSPLKFATSVKNNGGTDGRNKTYTVRITERSQNLFLPMIGIKTQDYNIVGSARISKITESR